MVFFQFKPSPLPKNVYICTSENTSQLTTIKTLLVVSLILGFLIPIASIITFAFAFFYLSKHSLRMRIFKIFTLCTIIQILFGFVLVSLISSIGIQPSSLKGLGMVILVGLFGLGIIFYLQWHLHKELSFITHEPLFFTAMKFIVIGSVIAVIFIMLGLTFESWIKGALKEMALSGAFLTCLFFIAGFITYVMAIFRFKFIIAYGENIQPNHY